MTPEQQEAMKRAWETTPSQDNEGWIPERGSFKAGFIAGASWQRKIDAMIARKAVVIGPGGTFNEPQTVLANALKLEIARQIEREA